MRFRPRLRREPVPPGRIVRPLLLHGRLWCGEGTAVVDGAVAVALDGTVLAAGPADSVAAPAGADELTGGWIGPGLVDSHVHLAFGPAAEALRRGVVAVRDLGAPPRLAAGWRRPADGTAAPRVAIAGPVLTAPGGYPSRGWGAGGFAAFVDDPEQATRLVDGLATAGVDVIKIALEPAGGPVPTPEVVAAVVAAARGRGLRVVAHALTVGSVETALGAGVAELAHTPVQPLPDELVARLAAADVRVSSTLATLARGPDREGVLDNARRLVSAGVPLCYGSDLGNTGTRPGADPAELRLLAEAGLGPEGALRAATAGAAAAAGLQADRFGPAGAGLGRIRAGLPAAIAVLPADPLPDPGVWRRPVAMLVGDVLLR